MKYTGWYQNGFNASRAGGAFEDLRGDPEQLGIGPGLAECVDRRAPPRLPLQLPHEGHRERAVGARGQALGAAVVLDEAAGGSEDLGGHGDRVEPTTCRSLGLLGCSLGRLGCSWLFARSLLLFSPQFRRRWCFSTTSIVSSCTIYAMWYTRAVVSIYYYADAIHASRPTIPRPKRLAIAVGIVAISPRLQRVHVRHVRPHGPLARGANPSVGALAHHGPAAVRTYRPCDEPKLFDPSARAGNHRFALF
jgi:hypothetical protein